MLIINGTIVNYDRSFKGHIRIQDEQIVAVGDHLLPLEGETILDAKDSYILPGGIDVHTHFDMPAGVCHTSDDFYTGSRAAISGGTTTIIDFAETDTDAPLQEGLDLWHKKAQNRSFCDYGFHMTLPRWDNNIEAEMKSMIDQGITSFKVYTAYKDSFGVDDKELYRIFEAAKRLQVRISIHCENGDILECRQRELWKSDKSNIRNHPLSRPNLVEKESVSRVIDIAEIVGAPIYIVHISTQEALKEVEEGKHRGVDVYGETCPHYLLFNEDKYNLPGFESAKYVMSPPLRQDKDQEALWKGLKTGIVDIIATDHCSFNYKGQKDVGRGDFTQIPNGIPSVEHRMELMLHTAKEHQLSLQEIVNVTATNPAKIFGLFPKKGIIQNESDADLILIRPETRHIISAHSQYQQVDYTPYEGMEVTMKITDVFLRGRQVVSNNQFVEEFPKGRYLHRTIE